jgi:hypothetical protein
MRPKDIETIEELIENNFTIYAAEEWFDDIKEMEFTKIARFHFIENKEVERFLKNLILGSNRALLGSSTKDIDYLNTANYKVLDEKIISDHLGIPFPLNHFMFDAMNDKVVRLVESGIIENIMKVKPKKPSDDEPTVLTLDHLLIWFYLGMALLLITTFVFFGEVLLEKVMKFRK